MRVTIVPIDNIVTIDGIVIEGVDLSFIDPSIHAVQWYGTSASVEYKDVTLVNIIKSTHQEEITDIAPFQMAIDAALAKKQENELKQQIVITNEMLSDQAYSQRSFLLFQSDWTQLPDNQLTQTEINLWREYRQQLRDITLQSGFPTEITWPMAPE